MLRSPELSCVWKIKVVAHRRTEIRKKNRGEGFALISLSNCPRNHVSCHAEGEPLVEAAQEIDCLYGKVKPFPPKPYAAMSLAIAQVITEHALNVRENFRIHRVMKPVTSVVEPLSGPEKTACITADLFSSLEKSYGCFSRPAELIRSAAPGGTAAENDYMRLSGHRWTLSESRIVDWAEGCSSRQPRRSRGCSVEPLEMPYLARGLVNLSFRGVDWLM